MNYGEFMKEVRERSGLDQEQAEKAVRATLNTLAQRLAGGEAKDLASQLPQELKTTVMATTGAGEGEPLSLDEFVATVGDREGCPPDAARKHASAVMQTLKDAVTPGEFEDLMAQLDREYRVLVAG